MVRTVLIAENQEISIQIPQAYVGRQVEIIAFTIDDAAYESPGLQKPLTHFASESALADDWLTPEEDKAWQSL